MAFIYNSAMRKNIFNSKAYSYLKYAVLAIYVLFVLIYLFRGELYAVNNKYLTIFAGTAPNLIPSFLFTLIGVFYVIPLLYKTTDVLFNAKFVWIINAINIFVFLLLEYLHVILVLGFWDNLDMIASLLGVSVATMMYFIFRKYFSIKIVNTI